MIKQVWLRYLFAFLFTALGVGLVALAGILLIKTSVLPNQPESFSSLQFLIMILVQALIFVALFLVVLRVFRFQSYSFKFDFSPGEAGLAFVGLLGLNFFVTILMRGLDVEVSQFEDFNLDALRASPFVFIFMTVVIAPLYEEYIFRGCILRFLADEDSSKGAQWGAAIFTSLLFSAVHMDLDAALPLFLISLYLCFWTFRKKSIALPITVHMIQNLMASIGLLYYPEAGF